MHYKLRYYKSKNQKKEIIKYISKQSIGINILKKVWKFKVWLINLKKTNISIRAKKYNEIRWKMRNFLRFFFSKKIQIFDNN